jgi:TonB family protein
MKINTTKKCLLIVPALSVALIFSACTTGKTDQQLIDSIQAKTTADSLATAKIMKGHAQPNEVKKHGKGMIVFQTDKEIAYEKQETAMIIEMDKAGIYNRAEIRPSYPGGQDALAKFIQENIVYPQQALDNGVEASVDVVFAVDENGKVYTPFIKGDKEGYGLDEAALVVVGKMPRWNPGQIKGKNVKSYYTLPISFKID